MNFNLSTEKYSLWWFILAYVDSLDFYQLLKLGNVNPSDLFFSFQSLDIPSLFF